METTTVQAVETWEQKQEREKAERMEKITEREKRFRKILKALSYEIEKEKEKSTWQADVTGTKDDGQIHLCSGTYRQGWDKLCVSGWYPRSKDGGYVEVYEMIPATRTDGSKYDKWERIPSPSINCSLSKTDEQIKRDIEKRFLPGFLKRLQAVKQKIAQENAYQTAKSNLLARLKAAANGKAPNEYEEKQGAFSEHIGKKEIRLEVKATADNARISTGDLTPEQAEQVIALIRKLAA